jgi:hypothetical protein
MTVGSVASSWFDNALVRSQGDGYWPAASSGSLTLTSKFRSLFRARIGVRPERRVRGRISLRMPYRPVRD